MIRKIFMILFISVFVFGLVGYTYSTPSQKSTIILNEQTFPDPYVRGIIKKKLSVSDNADITDAVKTITSISLEFNSNNHTGITDLEGIQHLTNLTSIDGNNEFSPSIKNIHRLGELTKLTRLTVADDNIYNVLSKVTIPNLNHLTIGYNETELLDSSKLSEIIKKQPNLNDIFIQYSKLTDLNWLSNTQLEEVDIYKSELVSNNAKLTNPAPSVKELSYTFNNTSPIDGLYSLTNDFPNLEKLSIGDWTNTTDTSWITNIDAFQSSLKELIIHNSASSSQEPIATNVRTQADKLSIFNLPKLTSISTFDTTDITIEDCPVLDISSFAINYATKIDIDNVKSISPPINTDITKEIHLKDIQEPTITFKGSGQVDILEINQEKTNTININKNLQVGRLTLSNVNAQTITVTTSGEIRKSNIDTLNYNYVTTSASPSYDNKLTLRDEVNITNLNDYSNQPISVSRNFSANNAWTSTITNLNKFVNVDTASPSDQFLASTYQSSLLDTMLLDSQNKLTIENINYNIKQNYQTSSNNIREINLNIAEFDSEDIKDVLTKNPKVNINLQTGSTQDLSHSRKKTLYVEAPTNQVTINVQLDNVSPYSDDYQLRDIVNLTSNIDEIHINEDISTTYSIDEVIINHSDTPISDNFKVYTSNQNTKFKSYRQGQDIYQEIDNKIKFLDNTTGVTTTEDYIDLFIRNRLNLYQQPMEVVFKQDSSNNWTVQLQPIQQMYDSTQTPPTLNFDTTKEYELDKYYLKASSLSDLIQVSDFKATQLPSSFNIQDAETATVIYTGNSQRNDHSYNAYAYTIDSEVQYQPIKYTTNLPTTGTYGDTLSLTVDITNGVPVKNIEVYYEDTLLTTLNKVSNNFQGNLVLNNKIPLGDIELDFKFNKEDQKSETYSNNFKMMPVTVTGVDYQFNIPSERQYDGTNNISITMSVSNFTPKFNDSFTFSYGENNILQFQGTADVGDKDIILSPDNIKMVGDNKEYYQLDKTIQNPNRKIKITPIDLSASLVNNINKFYDGTDDATVLISDLQITPQTSNLENIVEIVSAKYNDSNVGENKNITVTLNSKSINYTLPKTVQGIGEIMKANTQIGVQDIIYNDTVSYGETVQFKVKPTISNNRTLDTVEIYKDNVLLATSSSKDADYYVINYDTSDKKLVIGENQLQVKFLGNDNLLDSTVSINLTLNPRELTATYNLEYKYDGVTTKQALLSLSNNLSKDNFQITATLKLDEQTINAGDTPTVLEKIYSVPDGYYTLPNDNVTGTINILKDTTNLPQDWTTRYYIVNNLEKEYEWQLPIDNIYKNNYGSASITIEEDNIYDSSYYKNNPYIDTTSLKVSVNQIQSEEEKILSSHKLKISTTNYEDIEFMLEIYSSNKEKPILTVQPIIVDYGTNIDETLLNYTVKDSSNSDVTGQIEIKGDKGILDAGDYVYDVEFTPTSNDVYDTASSKLFITVNKIPVDMKTPPTTTLPTTTKDILENYDFVTNGEFLGYDGQVITDYQLEWSSPTTTVQINTGYEYTLNHKNYYYIGSLIPYPTYELPQFYPNSDTVVFPAGALVPNTPDANIDEDGNVKFPVDTVIELPNGDKINVSKPTVSYPDSDNNTIVTLPNGEIPTFDKDVILLLPPYTQYPTDKGTAELPNGGLCLPDGTIKPNFPLFVLTPDGDLIIPDNTIISPNVGYTKDEENIIISIPPSMLPDKFPEGNGGTITITPNGNIIYKPNQPETEVTTEIPTETTTEEATETTTQASLGSGLGAIVPANNDKITYPVQPDDSNKDNQQQKIPFNYIDGWYEDIIKDLYGRGVIIGDGNEFNPNKPITRADFSIMIYNMLSNVYNIQLPEVSEIYNYSDTPETAYYYKYVNSLSSLNILEGYGNDTFKPMNLITREETSVIVNKLIKYLNIPVIEKQNITYNDSDSISWWAKEYVEKATKYGLIMGYEDNSFRPKNNITRAESATIIYNLIQGDIDH